jgi:hypothetical protein
MEEITKLTSTDEEFINAMRNYPEEKLIIIGDTIASLLFLQQ